MIRIEAGKLITISINEDCIAGKTTIAISKTPMLSLSIPNTLDVFILADIPLTFEIVAMIIRKII